MFLVYTWTVTFLGYDHMNEEDEKEMFTIQKDILSQLGIERG